MPSFFLGETLKYLFLLFQAGAGAQNAILSATPHVFTTEAHLIPVGRWRQRRAAAATQEVALQPSGVNSPVAASASNSSAGTCSVEHCVGVVCRCGWQHQHMCHVEPWWQLQSFAPRKPLRAPVHLRAQMAAVAARRRAAAQEAKKARDAAAEAGVGAGGGGGQQKPARLSAGGLGKFDILHQGDHVWLHSLRSNEVRAHGYG